MSTTAIAGLTDYRVDVAAVGGVGELAAVLAREGVALFDGLRDEQALLQLTGRLGNVVPHRDSAASGITVIAHRGGPVGAGQTGFTDRPLDPHTDGSDRPGPPTLVVTVCANPATWGGECVLVDGKAVYSDLAATAPESLADLSAPHGAYFGDATGIVASVFEPQPDGHVGLRLRLDELARFSPHAQRSLPALRQAIDRHAITFGLEAGAGYVVNNRRWLHGRRAYKGRRVMARVLVEPHPAWRIRPGFEPDGAVPWPHD